MTALFWSIHIALICWLAWWGSQQSKNALTAPYYWYGLVGKLLTGILFGILYKYFLGEGDTWTYFDNALTLSNWALEDTKGYLQTLLGGSLPGHLWEQITHQGQPRAIFMDKIVSILAVVTGGNYWISSLYLSIFSFYGLWLLTQRISHTYPQCTKAALWALIFMPTIIFWSSGISKETVFAGGMGFILAWCWPYFKKNSTTKLWQWFLMVPLTMILFKLKYYHLAVLLPVILTTMIHKIVIPGKWHHDLRSPGFWCLIFIVLILGATFIHPNLRLSAISSIIKNNAALISSAGSADAAIHFWDHDNPPTWVLINLPWAIVTGLLRPNLGDWGSALQFLVLIENAFTSVMVIGRIRYLKNVDWRSSWWLPCLIYVTIMAGLLALSTPNFGTLIRYKVAFMPFFMLLILSGNPWWDGLTRKFP